MRIVLTAKAAEDLVRLRTFLADRNPDAANRAATSISRAIQSLADLAERGRPSGVPGQREIFVRFGASGYLIRYAYRAGGNDVVVIRIWHGREDRPA